MIEAFNRNGVWELRLTQETAWSKRKVMFERGFGYVVTPLPKAGGYAYSYYPIGLCREVGSDRYGDQILPRHELL